MIFRFWMQSERRGKRERSFRRIFRDKRDIIFHLDRLSVWQVCRAYVYFRNSNSHIYISTRSTLTPHGSVASSREVCMVWEMVSRSARISARLRIPRTVRKVLAANNLVEWLGKWRSNYIIKVIKKNLVMKIRERNFFLKNPFFS